MFETKLIYSVFHALLTSLISKVPPQLAWRGFQLFAHRLSCRVRARANHIRNLDNTGRCTSGTVISFLMNKVSSFQILSQSNIYHCCKRPLNRRRLGFPFYCSSVLLGRVHKLSWPSIFGGCFWRPALIMQGIHCSAFPGWLWSIIRWCPTLTEGGPKKITVMAPVSQRTSLSGMINLYALAAPRGTTPPFLYATNRICIWESEREPQKIAALKFASAAYRREIQSGFVQVIRQVLLTAVCE